MAKAIISYDKDLPEIPDRRPWEKPASFLVKDPSTESGWRVDASGRRPSRLLLIPKLRSAVGQWRDDGYPGASEVTRRLFDYWFDEDHEVAGFAVPFRYHFCQREAIETLVYLVEVARIGDAKALVDAYAEVFHRDLLSKSIEFQTTMDGQRQIRRYVPELEAEGVQDLPPEDLWRYAFKMATGSGKTWVMAMAMVWALFHKKREPDSDLSTNFLIIAPNVIVYQRLEKDFGSNRIFHELPLIPPEWRGTWSQKVILRGESTEPDPSGNLLLTNIHQLYESRDQEWTPQNAIEALLGRKPAKDLAASQRSMLERIKELKDLVVLNDEAHHVHDDNLAWSQSLLSIHRALPQGLSLWLDFSATPKDQNGMYFPWTVCDYPLAQAVEDRIVKAPIIVTKEDDPRQPAQDPDHITKDNVAEKYGYWIQAAVQRWKEHDQIYRKFGTRPVLFIMAERNIYADAIGQYLWKTKEFGFRESEVLVIHTDAAGEITKKDLEQARQVARDIDQAGSRIKAIVSVMMLREGWDVRTVSIVLGLRPFTARAEILPEQVIGRGLRLMTAIGPDRTQTLEVLGTRNLLNVLREQLEVEGVGVASTSSDPPRPVIIEPVQDRLATRCFGKAIDVDHDTIRSHLQRLEMQEGIARYLARSIAKLTVEKREIEFEKADFKLSATKPFQWRRNLPPLTAERTVFNYVATYNDFERRFAQFLDTAADVLRFASLGTTEQGDSGAQFRIDYLKPSGAIGFYHPDWVVVQQTDQGEQNWIIETKGRVWEGTEDKDAAMRDWCARVSEQTGVAWLYVRVDQSGFDAQRPTTLAEVTRRGGEAEASFLL